MAKNGSDNSSKQKTTNGSTAATASSSSSSITEHVNRAEQTVLRNKLASEQLHASWRRHLLNLSFLLLAIGLHQAQTFIGGCVKDIKLLNEQRNPEQRIPGYEAFGIVVKDSMEYIVGLFMTGALGFFLVKQDPPGNFSSLPYTIANACIPIVFAFRYNRPAFGCVDEALLELELQPTKRSVGFPVVLLFHCIVTACYWFMGVQAKQQENNVRAVQKLRKDMEEVEEKRRNSAKKK